MTKTGHPHAVTEKTSIEASHPVDIRCLVHPVHRGRFL